MYFDWQRYPFRRPPELDGRAGEHAVAIVGGGPVGLAMALALARMGVASVVLEADDTLSDGSRAIGVHRRSTQFMDWLGIGATFREKALERARNVVFYRDQPVYEVSYDQPASEKHPVLVCLQQCWMEQLLLDGCLASGLVDIRWSSSVETLDERGEKVSLRVVTSDGAYDLESDYVVAADGARGAARRCLGLDYEDPIGADLSERRFVITDFHMPSALPPGRRLWLNPPTRPGSIVIMHSQPFDIWRLDYAVEDDEDAEAAATPARARARIAEHLAMMGIDGEWELVWTTTYRARARTLPDYRHGRVFFAGDSAHQTPIFGGRGLNLGYADCFNLAWKLAYVLRGIAAPALLDTYSPERRGIVLEALADLAQATIFMTRPSKGVALMRDAVLDLCTRESFVGGLFDAYKARRGETYGAPLARAGASLGASSGVAAWPAVGDTDDPGPAAGAPIPDARLEREGADVFLYDLLHTGFTGLFFVRDGIVPGDMAALARHLSADVLPFAPVLISRDGPGVPDGWIGARDRDGAAFRAFGVRDTGFYLLRPDLHVLGRWHRVDMADIDRALAAVRREPREIGAVA